MNEQWMQHEWNMNEKWMNKMEMHELNENSWNSMKNDRAIMKNEINENVW